MARIFVLLALMVTAIVGLTACQSGAPADNGGIVNNPQNPTDRPAGTGTATQPVNEQ